MLRHTKAAAAAAALQIVLALNANADPRPISDAERAGVEVVAAFLANGPTAVWDRLSSDAPLRGLSRDEALEEIAVRTGPGGAAHWTLQTVSGGRLGDVAFHVTFPSGDDDGLLFRMKKSGDRWMLHEVLTLAEDPAPPAAVATPAPDRSPIRTTLLLAALVLGILTVLISKRSRWLSGIALLFATIALLLAFNLSRIPFAAPRKELPFKELRALLPLRQALARGDEPRIPQGVSAAARDVGMLWILQSGRALAVRGNATDPLAGLVTVARSPLTEIVRARLALTKGQPSDAAAAFARALDMQPSRDDIVMEAATSFGVSEAALPFLRDARFDGSRDAWLHYARAMQAVSDGNETAAQSHLRIAWRLRPIAREELIREPRLVSLLRDAGTMSMVSFYASEEALQRSTHLGRSPVPLPSGAQAFVSGESLTIDIGEATLEVPGGAALAPANARVVSATYWKREDDAGALRDATTLLDQPASTRSNTGTLRLTRAVEALSDHNRWSQVVTLTERTPSQTAFVTPRLLALRLQALLRMHRFDDARALADGAAVRELIERRAYPSTLLSIADAVANSGSNGESGTGSWDTAEKLYRAITATPSQQPVIEMRLRQLDLRRTLATNGVVISTPHFDIRHDPTMNPAIAGRIGDLLEAELARLQQRLGEPETKPRRVTVNVLYWDDFRGSITGVDHIVGLYDGEILFPFAVVNQFKPEVVAIISHELTHAIVAQATADNAPRWFQEGIAERMELVPLHENAFHETAPELVLPLPLLDAVMENNADAAMSGQAYRVAQTFIRFLESRFGSKAIPTLIAAFAEGKNTDDALAALTGKSLDALNRDFREWGFANNANFVNTERFPYGDLYSPGIDPRIKAGFKWSTRKQSR